MSEFVQRRIVLQAPNDGWIRFSRTDISFQRNQGIYGQKNPDLNGIRTVISGRLADTMSR